MCIFFLTTTILTHENEHKESEYYKINVKEKGKVYDNTAKMQSTNQLGV